MVEQPPQSLRTRVTGLLGGATLAGIIIGVVYWALEAALHAWVFGDGSFVGELFQGSPNELWMRSLTVVLFVVLGAVVQWHLNGARAWGRRLRRLAAAVEQAGDSVLISDAQGLIEYVNPAFTRLTGYALAEVRGKKPSVLKSGTRDELFYRNVWATITAGKVWSGSIVDRRKDGTYYPASLTIAPVLDEQGTATHFIGVQHDMSAQAELEERLRQTEKLQTLGTLAAGIAHDFNNVLAVVVMQLELAALRARDDAEMTQLLHDLGRSLGGAKDLVKQLVAFSRRGSATTSLESFEFRPWLADVWPTLRLLVPDPLALRLESPESSSPWLRADEQALQQALTNLVQNARDVLLPRGHGLITVAWEVVEDGGQVVASAGRLARTRCLWLRVCDDGPGIPAELEHRIFEPFFTTKGERGTGLGLAMVKETVHRHGGVLWVTSKAGQGATFHLLLPIATPPDAER